MNKRQNNYIPLRSNKLRFGDELPFNIYIKMYSSRTTNTEYRLFCRQGQVYKPGYFTGMKFENIQFVYYLRRDKEIVDRYLEHLRIVDDTDIYKYNSRALFGPKIKENFYIPMPAKSLKAGSKFNFDIFVKSKIIRSIGRMDYKHTILISKGDNCNQELVNNLRTKGVEYVFFRQQDEANVLEYLYNYLEQMMGDDEVPADKKAEAIYDVALLWTMRFYYNKTIRTPNEMVKGFKLIDYLLNVIDNDKHYYKWIMGLCRYGKKLHAHCLNTCIVGLALTKNLGWPDNEVREFSRGVLLHDIGMIEIPDTLLNKPGRLLENEMEMIKQHPQDSCDIINEISPLGPNAMVMILQHHECGDGSGYPQGLKLPQIHLWARLLRIIDNFEAMTSNRSWRDKYDYFYALEIMQEKCLNKNAFDDNYLDDFANFLSLTGNLR